MSKILPLVCVSLIWFAIGWIAHEFAPSTLFPAQLPPEQLRVLKAQKILQDRQLLLEQPIEDIAVPNAFSEAAIDGMLSWSRDRHAELYGPQATERYYQSFDDNFGITNLQFDELDGQLIVTHVFDDSPAKDAGIEAGDILLGVDEILFDEFMGAPEAALLLQGPAGSTYTLTFTRGNERLTRTIKRQERTYLTDDLIVGQHGNQIGYIKIDYFFPEKTEQLFEAALEKFSTHEIRGFILDLRGNDGGYPVVANKLIGYFLQPETLLYTMILRDGTQHEFFAEGDGRFAEIPMAVLIDKGTWSAGEIATAALANRSQTQLFGTATAGKGIVQETIPLDDEYMLHFTVAKWLTSTGEWVHQKGVAPDVQIEDNPATVEDEVLIAAVTYVETLLAQGVEE